MFIFSHQFGVFSLTDAVPRQHLIVVMEKGYYKSSSNEDFIKSIESAIEKNPNEIWPAMHEVLGEYGNKRVIQLTNECYKKNLKAFIYDRIQQISKDSTNDYIFGYLTYKDYGNDRIKEGIIYLNLLFRINVKNTLIMMAIVVMLLVRELFIKKIKWITLGLCASMVGTFFVSYYGKCSEYPRTMLIMVPITYVSVAYILSYDNSLNENKECIKLEHRRKK